MNIKNVFWLVAVFLWILALTALPAHGETRYSFSFPPSASLYASEDTSEINFVAPGPRFAQGAAAAIASGIRKMAGLQHAPQLFLVGIVTLFVVSGECLAADSTSPVEDPKARAAWLANHVRDVNPSTLLKTENALVVAELRELSKSDLFATILLLRAGDDFTTMAVLSNFRSSSLRRRSRAAVFLKKAASPDLFARLEADLAREEGAELHTEDEVVAAPRSTAVARIMQETILRSESFSPEMKEWAQGLPTRPAVLRETIRSWWKINRAALIRKEYSAVVRVPISS